MNTGNIFGLEWEYQLIIFLQNTLPTPIIKFLTLITKFGDEYFMIAIIGTIYWVYDKKLGQKLLLNISFASILFSTTKSLVKRLRPYMVSEKIKCLEASTGDPYDPQAQGYSFPSGHSCNIASVIGPIIKNYANKILKISLTTLMILVLISRIVLGVHYPTDVLAGTIVGLGTWHLIEYFNKKIGQTKTQALFLSLGLIGFFLCKSDGFYTGYGVGIGAVLAFHFEEKYVNFQKAQTIKEALLRLLGGAIIYYGLTTILKMPFSESFLESQTTAQHLVRLIRYTIVIFIDIGVYPLCFKYFEKK